MRQNLSHLLRTRRFLPLFVTQALGALNDNVFRNALFILVTYRIAVAAGSDAQIQVTLAAGLFILPFFLFSALAGQLADKYEKARLIRLVKFCEIPIMGLAAAGFFIGEAGFLMAVLFLMGTQSTFFGPLKYGILPDLLADDELIGGNGLIEAGTFLAILAGTIAGGLLILTDRGIEVVSASLIGLALAGWAASFLIPRAAAAAPDLKVNPNILAETRRIVVQAAESRAIMLSILGISWFWLVGATLLAQFPAYAKDVLGADQGVVTLFLSAFTIGIGLGSLLCNKLLGGEITAKYVPFGALGMTLFSVDLYFASAQAAPLSAALVGVAEFLSRPASWRILADLLGIAFCGGIYSVPLYAILQSRSDADNRARTIAANNIVNALFMVAAAAATTAMLAAGFSVPQVFLAIGVVNAGVAIYICGLLPDEVLKTIATLLFRLLYRVEVKGWDNYRAAGERAVIVVNHVSFLDASLLAALLPGRPTFAVNTYIAERWWVKPFLTLVDAIPVDPTNPFATKSLIKAVREGRKCVIFPEGRITVTGGLMKIYEGPGLIADKAGATLLPVRIDGAQYTAFSRLGGKVRRRWFPKITITILAPQSIDIDPEIKGRERRRLIGIRLYDEMTDMVFETCDRRRTLYQALLDARAIHGGGCRVVEDIERRPMTYNRLLRASLVLGRRLSRLAGAGEAVGVMLPNSTAAAVTFFALQAHGRVPAMLNFSTGERNLIAACRAARLGVVLTSRRFLERAQLGPLADAVGEHARIVYLEDMQRRIGPIDRLYGLAAPWMAGAIHRRSGAGPGDAAVIMFTSGSEGTPKGVVLSHENLLANRYQLTAVLDFNPTDVVFNALPVFHSFGLTGGMLLPVLSGIKTFLYASPLHYRVVPELVYDTDATIMFGTDTFLAGYARSADAYDFYSVRYVFAGAEKVKDETRRVWSERFGLRILEGYGATETSPALATNTPMRFKAGTVGRFLPGIEVRLEPVPGVARGGRLSVRGPNVMLGYLRAENPGELEPPEDGWYDTGDIVEVDAHGFVTIVGRVKRFAKIAGEMVSLGAVEDHVSALWPAHRHAVVSLPDPRKGEQLVLVTDCAEADRGAILVQARNRGMVELMVPRTVILQQPLPVLGTGKIDYVAVTALAEAVLAGG